MRRQLLIGLLVLVLGAASSIAVAQDKPGGGGGTSTGLDGQPVPPQTVTNDTPPPPAADPEVKGKVWVLGDSVSSGHNQTARGSSLRTDCDDPAYAYGRWTHEFLADRDGESVWFDRAAGYRNEAHSGFGTRATEMGDEGQERIGRLREALLKRRGRQAALKRYPRLERFGGITQPGYNACLEFVEDDPLTTVVKQIEDWVEATSGTGVRRRTVVLLTGGVNNTNWTRVIKDIIKAQFLSRRPLRDGACDAILRKWDGRAEARRITADVTKIIRALRGADPDAQILWNLYFNMAGTGTMPTSFVPPETPKWGIENRGPFVSEECKPSLQDRVDVLNRAIRAGIGASGEPVTVVDQGTVLSYRNNLLQPLFITEGMIGPRIGSGDEPTAWPHPSVAGHREMAQAIVPQVSRNG